MIDTYLVFTDGMDFVMLVLIHCFIYLDCDIFDSEKFCKFNLPRSILV